MDINVIIAQLKEKFGDKLDVDKVQGLLGKMDLSKMNFNEIVEKIQTANILGDLDGDGKVESIADELKGKAANMFGGLFGKK